ncbi:Glutathione Stransferase [Balamuthia mandrillaris]
MRSAPPCVRIPLHTGNSFFRSGQQRCLASSSSSSSPKIAIPSIEFFDINSALQPKASWSPFTTRIRMVLNYKGIPHSTTWLSYPDIAPTLTKLGVPPLTTDHRGRTHTCPAIRHDAVVLQDSFPVALYLEKTFTSCGSSAVPNGARNYPTIFPGAGALPLAQMVNHHAAKRVVPAALPLMMPKMAKFLDERGAEHFRRTRRQWFGKDVEDWLKEDQEALWKALEQELAIYSDVLTPAAATTKKEGPFMMGAQVSYADFVLMAFFQWAKMADTSYWERVMAMGKDDSFLRLWKACEQWLPAQP